MYIYIWYALSNYLFLRRVVKTTQNNAGNHIVYNIVVRIYYICIVNTLYTRNLVVGGSFDYYLTNNIRDCFFFFIFLFFF